MPIVEVEIVMSPVELLDASHAALVAERLGEIFDSAPGTTWVKLRKIARQHYAENGGGPPMGTLPIFVSILKQEMPAKNQLRDEIRLLTTAIAEICDRPEQNVHILYLPEAAGRIAFGGNMASG